MVKIGQGKVWILFVLYISVVSFVPFHNSFGESKEKGFVAISTKSVGLDNLAWLVRDRKTKIVTIYLSFPGGYLNVPFGKIGLAGVAQDALFYPSVSVKKYMDTYGIKAKVYMEATRLSVSYRFPLAYGRQAMSFLKKRILLEDIQKEDIEKNKQVWQNEFSWLFNSEKMLPNTLSMRSVWKKMPMVLGHEKDVASLGKADVVNYLRSIFVAKGTRVVMIGNLDRAPYLLDDVARLLKRLRGHSPLKTVNMPPSFFPLPTSWGHAAKKALRSAFVLSSKKEDLETRSKRLNNLALSNKPIIAMKLPWAKQGVLNLFFKGVPISSPDYAKFFVLVHVLGDGLQSRLSTKIRKENGWAYSVSAGNAELSSGLGSYMKVYALVDPKHTLDSLKMIQKVFINLKNHGITKDELRQSVRLIRSRMQMGYQSNESIANKLGFFSGYGLAWNKDYQLAQELSKLSLSSENAFIKKYITGALQKGQITFLTP